MTFTYDLASANALTRALSEVRMELGDTESGRGVRATGANITDEALAVVYAREGSLVMRTAAACCEMLARDWSRVASTSVGPRSSQYGALAEAWAKRAGELRKLYGYAAGVGVGRAFSVGMVRDDGYANQALDFEGADFV